MRLAVNGLSLNALECGSPSAPLLLLTHGITAQGHIWEPFAERLAGDFHVVALDQRGHGDSDKPDRGYAAADYVADMLGVLDSLGVERAILVGHSLGARNSLCLAAAHPERVQAVVAVEYGPWIARDHLDTLDQRVLSAPRRFASRDKVVMYLKSRYTRHDQRALDLRVDYGLSRTDTGALEWKYSPAAVEQTLRGFRTDFVYQTLRVTAPTLVVRGTETSLYDKLAFERLKSIRTDFHFVEVDGATHYIPEEQPEMLADMVREFLP